MITRTARGYLGYMIGEEELTDGTLINFFYTNDQHMVDKEKSISIINKLKDFYEREDVDTLLEDYNNQISYHYALHNLDTHLTREKKSFKKSRNRSRAWVFRCSNCDARCEDDLMGDHYYQVQYNYKSFSCCSEKCSKELHKDIYQKEKAKIEKTYGI